MFRVWDRKKKRTLKREIEEAVRAWMKGAESHDNVVWIVLAAFLAAVFLAVTMAFAFSRLFTRRLDRLAERIRHLTREVNERQLLMTQSQAKYLQSQLDPHFQSNILAMLSIKAKSAGNEELYQNLLAFSRLVQGKIFRKKDIRIRVREEMELVEFYLFLQKSRFRDKIFYEIRYGSEELKEDLIPKLLIEPLVENAVSHGLEPKDGQGRIQVDLFEKEERLHIVVEDDGVGYEEDGVGCEGGGETPASGKSGDDGETPAPGKSGDDGEGSGGIGHTHTALENIRRLLFTLYGENQSFVIRGEKGKGTRIEIELPIERGKADVEGSCGG